MSGIAYPIYAQPLAGQEKALDAALADHSAAVLVDVSRPEDLQAVGQLVWRRVQHERLLAVGPSSVVQALATQWPCTGMAAATPLAPARWPVFVLAGSLSPVTVQQVRTAVSYEQVPVDVGGLLQGGEAAIQALADRLGSLLRGGRSVLAVTAGSASGGATAHEVAQAGGWLLARVLAQAPLRRIGIAGGGGGTSSPTVQSLAAWGLSYRASLSPGAALCRLHSEHPALDGLEIMLKGGQMGPEELFERLLHGGA